MTYNNHIKFELFLFQVSSKESRSGSQVLTDLTAAAEPVSSKKNLFEAGEAWNQNAGSVTLSKVKDEVHFITHSAQVMNNVVDVRSIK